MRRIGVFALLIASAFLITTATARPRVVQKPVPRTTCPVCAERFAFLKKQDALQKETTELLGRNNAYLASVSAKEASKYLKVQSNIFFILKRLDQIKYQTAVAENEFQKEGCVACYETGAK